MKTTKISQYRLLCETLKPGDILELVPSSANMLIVLESNMKGPREQLEDYRTLFPIALLSSKDPTIFYVEEVVAYSEAFTPWLSSNWNGMGSVFPWERFIRLRNVETLSLYWITARSFDTVSPHNKVDCFVNGKMVE